MLSDKYVDTREHLENYVADMTHCSKCSLGIEGMRYVGCALGRLSLSHVLNGAM